MLSFLNKSLLVFENDCCAELTVTGNIKKISNVIQTSGRLEAV